MKDLNLGDGGRSFEIYFSVHWWSAIHEFGNADINDLSYLVLSFAFVYMFFLFLVTTFYLDFGLLSKHGNK
jgi:hypothetical protein